MWPSSPGNGYLGLYIDDDISHTRLPSTLRNSATQLCSASNDSLCGNSTVSVYAILPPCSASVQNDCIEAVGSKTQAGAVDTGTFSRFFPEQGLADFTGDSAAKIPNGSPPSIWTLPNTPHAAGNEYMAIVSVSGTVDALRKSLGSSTIHASLYPVKVVAGQFSRNVPSSTGFGVSHPSRDTWANCASLAEGYCAARQDFPTETAFSLSLRLSTPPTGWLHGRIFSPNISLSTSDGVTRLRVEATPARVPAIATWGRVDQLPSSISSPCTVDAPNCGQLNPQSAGAHTAVENWRTVYGDKASWVRGHWMFMTLANYFTSACLKDTGVLYGFVTTNATGYVAGPPDYTSSNNSFSYTVASPHLDEGGAVIEGTYNFVIRSSTARCLYGIDEGAMSATVTISEAGGSTQSPATVNVSDDGEWLKVSVSGFHYSSPVIKTTLTSTTPRTIKTEPTRMAAPSLTTAKKVTGLSIAKYAGLSVAAGSKISVTVSTTSRKVCTVVGSSVKGLRKGTCTLRVTVTPKKGKPVSKVVRLVVTK